MKLDLLNLSVTINSSSKRLKNLMDISMKKVSKEINISMNLITVLVKDKLLKKSLFTSLNRLSSWAERLHLMKLKSINSVKRSVNSKQLPTKSQDLRARFSIWLNKLKDSNRLSLRRIKQSKSSNKNLQSMLNYKQLYKP